MGEVTGIGWTDATYNPWWGCTQVSPGCDHCYALALDKRTGGKHWGAGAPRREFSEKHWNEPRKWNLAAAKAGVLRRVFCASMADVFDPEVPPAWRDRLWSLIRDTPALTWQLLTKRPHLIPGMLPADWGDGWVNVWLGTTVEDMARAALRVPRLIAVSAEVRFLSCEPLLEELDLRRWLDEPADIQWVIAGGESGAVARPINTGWVRSLRDQCAESGTAFFFKQWGGRTPKSGGKELDGRVHCAFPEEVRHG